MDRRKDLIEYIKEYREIREQNIKTFITEHITENIPLFQAKLRFLITEQIKKQRNEDIKFIFLCQTLSSGYTGSNEAILGMSSDMLYLDDDRSQVFWCPELFYRGVDEDLAEVEKILRKKFQRLEEYELLYIKRHLLNDIWDLIPEFFCAMLKQSINLITDSPLCLEDEVFFLCGKYMDNLKVVWSVGKGNDNG